MVKHIDKVKRAWLYEELADLREHGVIDETAESRIRSYYAETETEPVATVNQERAAADGSAKSGKNQYFLVVLVSLGVLMVGCGVILLFAHNWDMLSVFQRVVAAFIPVVAGVLCGVYTIMKKKDARWREASAFFTAVGFAVLTALISQIYNTGGTLLDFLRLVMAVSLPLVYIFSSQMLTVLYCAGILGFLRYGLDGYPQADLFYVAGIAPFILYYLFFHKPEGTQAAQMRYICLMPLLFLLIHSSNGGAIQENFFAAAGLLYTAGLYYSETKRGVWRNPWLICGWVLLTVLLTVASSSPYFLSDRYYLSGLWCVILAAQMFVIARKPTPLKAAVMLAALLPVAVALPPASRDVSVWLASACFLMVGASALWEGARGRGLIKINAGMVQIAILVAIRFADPDMSILTRSAILIVIGLAFIAINVYLSRKFKNEKAAVSVGREAKDDV